MNLLRPAIVLVILITAALTIAWYPQLPDRVVSHWNAAGDADGYLPRFWGAALVPLLMIGLAALLVVMPKIDPLRANYGKFRGYYEGFILVMMLFLAAIQLQILLWGTGVQVSPNLTMPVLIGILIVYLGFLIEHAEPNWFVGIRTPWTLSSDEVWRKTHARGGILFKAAGLISCAGILVPAYAIAFILVPILAVSAYTVIYSYLAFREGQR